MKIWSDWLVSEGNPSMVFFVFKQRMWYLLEILISKQKFEEPCLELSLGAVFKLFVIVAQSRNCV